jgi:hypothetical protein
MRYDDASLYYVNQAITLHRTKSGEVACCLTAHLIWYWSDLRMNVRESIHSILANYWF